MSAAIATIPSNIGHDTPLPMPALTRSDIVLSELTDRASQLYRRLGDAAPDATVLFDLDRMERRVEEWSRVKDAPPLMHNLECDDSPEMIKFFLEHGSEFTVASADHLKLLIEVYHVDPDIIHVRNSLLPEDLIAAIKEYQPASLTVSSHQGVEKLARAEIIPSAKWTPTLVIQLSLENGDLLADKETALTVIARAQDLGFRQIGLLADIDGENVSQTNRSIEKINLFCASLPNELKLSRIDLGNSAISELSAADQKTTSREHLERLVSRIAKPGKVSADSSMYCFGDSLVTSKITGVEINGNKQRVWLDSTGLYMHGWEYQYKDRTSPTGVIKTTGFSLTDKPLLQTTLYGASCDSADAWQPQALTEVSTDDVIYFANMGRSTSRATPFNSIPVRRHFLEGKTVQGSVYNNLLDLHIAEIPNWFRENRTKLIELLRITRPSEGFLESWPTPETRLSILAEAESVYRKKSGSSISSHVVQGLKYARMVLEEIKSKFNLVPNQVRYAVKCCTDLVLLTALKHSNQQGKSYSPFAVDVATKHEGETTIALGFPKTHIHLSHPRPPRETVEWVKNRADLIAGWTVDSVFQLNVYDVKGVDPRGKQLEIRLKLSVDPGSNKNDLNSKFGASADEAIRIYQHALELGYSPENIGLSGHPGTQCFSNENYLKLADLMVTVANRINTEVEFQGRRGYTVKKVNLGGGICDEQTAIANGKSLRGVIAEIGSVATYVRGQFKDELGVDDLDVALEPGRVVSQFGVVAANVLETRVQSGEITHIVGASGNGGLLSGRKHDDMTYLTVGVKTPGVAVEPSIPVKLCGFDGPGGRDEIPALGSQYHHLSPSLNTVIIRTGSYAGYAAESASGFSIGPEVWVGWKKNALTGRIEEYVTVESPRAHGAKRKYNLAAKYMGITMEREVENQAA